MARQDLDWERDGSDWPNREASRFVRASGLTWHVQVAGHGPVLLLLHGTGGSTHSWAGMLADLQADFTVIAPDLPAHGFTQTPAPYGLSLPGMAQQVTALLAEIGLSPDMGIGHSAGAAILARMVLDGGPVRALVSINGAFLPFGGWAGRIFSPLAKLMALNPVTPRLFARQHDDPVVIGRIIRGTGSQLDARAEEYYRRLVTSPRHVAGALGMMANWDLRRLEREVAELEVPVALVSCAHDRTVPPRQADGLAARICNAERIALPWGGHLGHEERPAEMAALVRQFARATGVLPAAS
jgi:magnesium chelatase accessory protein